MAATILLVVEHHRQGQTLSEWFSSALLADCVIETACNHIGRDAALTSIPELIIVDLDTLTVEGLELVRGLMRRIPRLPLVVVGPGDSSARCSATEELAASAYVSKTRLTSELASIVRGLLYPNRNRHRASLAGTGQCSDSSNDPISVFQATAHCRIT
jgi:DNA-binding NarL/FixJ family response regulator